MLVPMLRVIIIGTTATKTKRLQLPFHLFTECHTPSLTLSFCFLTLSIPPLESLHPYTNHFSLSPPLLRHRRTKHLRPEEPALRPLDDLLVHTLRRVVHDDRALLVVDLGVDPRVSDQVHNPLLAFILV